jgi:AbrB family looped-hinge helix DNA binding protein
MWWSVEWRGKVCYLTGMNAITRMSAKGQIVIPKDVRDALGWPEGTPIEVVRGAKSVTLVAQQDPKADFDQEAWLARLRAIANYHGPRYDDRDYDAAIDAMFREGKDLTI